MIFKWEDGYEKEIPFGGNVRGLTRMGKRPVSVAFTGRDLALLTADVDPDIKNEYIWSLSFALE